MKKITTNEARVVVSNLRSACVYAADLTPATVHTGVAFDVT
jgi:hypothetical protein